MNGRRVLVLACLSLCLLIGKIPTVGHANQEHRVVAVAGSLTEILYSLDLQDLLVGVDTTSQWPEEVSKLPAIGYQRALSAEGILALAPSLILATADAGPPEVLQQLEDAGVRIETFDKDYTLVGLYHRIRSIGQWLGKPAEAETLVEKIQADILPVTSHLEGSTPPRVAFLLGAEAGSVMAAGSGTSADAMIQFAGGNNALSDYEGYKAVNAEALIVAAPDYLLVVQHGKDADPQRVIDAVAALPGVAQTPAGRQQRIIVLDGLRFLGFGPRLGEAVADLAAQLHPLPTVQ